MNLLEPSRYEWGASHHGQHLPRYGLDIMGLSGVRFIRRMRPALSLDPPTQRFESGMLTLVQWLGSLLQGIMGR